MIKTYKYIETNHCKLHEFIIAFFERIENETGVFNDSFFHPDFLPIVNRHPKTLKARCVNIYNLLKTWQPSDKTRFIQQLKDSNEIEQICSGLKKPLDETQLPSDIRNDLKKLFICLYEDILKKCDEFIGKYGSLKDHFKIFKEEPNDFIICPACGIQTVKTIHDKERDQYDHYLPKDIYPLSSVNFRNLVPICTECNSILVKGAKDVLKDTTGKLFYPYDGNHKGINIDFKLIKDDLEIEKTQWVISYSNADNKNDEIASWKYIYNIEQRYTDFTKGRLKKWYKNYWDTMSDGDLKDIALADRQKVYFKSLQKGEEQYLNFIQFPALKALREQSLFVKAEHEAKLYSL
jgi:hypothetical protein